MKPIIIISSQSLACGCLLVEALAKSQAEKETPHLVLEAPLPPWEKIMMELKIQCQEPILPEARLLKRSAFERANPNQPWYARFRKHRR